MADAQPSSVADATEEGLHAATSWIEQIFARLDAAMGEAVAATIKDAIGQRFEAARLGFIPDVWTQKVSAFILPLLEEAYQSGAISASIQLPAAKAAYEQAVPDAVPEVLNPLQEERMLSYSNRLRGIGNEIWEAAQVGMAEGMAAGEGIPDLAARVQASAQVSTPRATTIARTEVISAANAGTMDQARIFQPYHPVRKEWLCTHDARTRPSHFAANGQEIGLEERFTVGGSALDFPGDPGGAPGEVINCRCTVLFNDAPIDEVLPLSDPNVVPELTAAAEEDDMAEDEVPADSTEEWHGVLVVEGIESGDMPKREFAAGSLEWRNLPLPIGMTIEYSHGPGENKVVETGAITRIERIGGEIHGWGSFHATPEGDRHRAAVGAGTRRLSIDGDNVKIDDIEYIMPDSMDPESDEAMLTMPEKEVYHYARIMGVTDVPFPAFQETYIELVGASETAPVTGSPELPGDGVADDPTIDDESEGAAPDEFVNSGIMIALAPDAESVQRLSLGPDLGLEDDDLHLTLRYLGNVGETDEAQKEQAFAAASEMANHLPLDGEAFAAALFNPTGDEPAVVMLVDSDGVRELEAGIDESLKAPDAHAFNPHLTLEYPPSEAFGEAFQRAVERVGPVRFDRVRVAWGDENRFFPEGDEEDEVILASAFPVAPPLAWFQRKADGPTAWTVEDSGEVYGHVALHGTCHIGVAGACVTPPKEAAEYSYFNTGSIVTAEGEQVAVGQITMGTGHAPKGVVGFAAAEHYDNTGVSSADVHATVDEWGIWVAGAARPDLTDSQVREMRAGVISGDWRKFGTGLRLVAALLVNVPGFPVPRTAAHVHKGQQTALVASGIVVESAPPIHGRSSAAITARAERIAARIGRDRRSRADALAARIRKD